MQAAGGLEIEFSRLPKGPLCFVTIAIVVDETTARLKVWDQTPVRLNEVVAQENGRPHNDVAKTEKNRRGRELEKRLDVAANTAIFRARRIEHAPQTHINGRKIEAR